MSLHVVRREMGRQPCFVIGQLCIGQRREKLPLDRQMWAPGALVSLEGYILSQKFWELKVTYENDWQERPLATVSQEAALVEATELTI